MKILVILAVVFAVALARPEQFYSTKYENFNAKELAGNVRLLKAYGKCFLEKGPCTPEGTDFKKTIPDALRDTCNKCSPKQRKLIRDVIHGFQNKTPDLWIKIMEKEDPEKTYRKSFDDFIAGTD